jgi:hypothetical protein
MKAQSAVPQYYYAMPMVHHANILHDSNDCFASTINSYVDVTGDNDTRYVASANTFVNALHHIYHNYGYYGQESMSTVNSLSFNATSNIQHTNSYSSAISSQYVVPPQDMTMNEKIGYDYANYLANYSQNSAPYANVHIHNLASNSSRINENSARCANGNTHDSASHIAPNSSRINERWVNIHTHDSAPYVANNSSQIKEFNKIFSIRH